ncbi:Ubiquitin-related modifier 1 like protein [Aduncisulcus paluster]|uniref:Ubiquitin-related modifier 1 homolog n=1 Tax=Aduncisulcus paluster TaxID=2918883 RepID=A0ABQ5JX04_9EUKA|nr:Ubiquitin-related modifier 1 like protein [Aduncisulcus paluster]
MPLLVKLIGGCEFLFAGKSQIEVPHIVCHDLLSLCLYLSDNFLSVEKDEFLEDGELIEGFIVLINDTDIELFDGMSTELSDGDSITFISTMHGG